MKKFLAVAFFVTLATVVQAQGLDISNAVGFKKLDVKQEQVKEPVKDEKAEVSEMVNERLPKIDTSEIMKKKTKNIEVFDDRRIAKRTYGQLKGIQESIEQNQKEKLEENKYPSEEAKQKAKEEIEEQALFHFEEFKDKPDDLKSRINKDSRKSLLDMAAGISNPSQKIEQTDERSAAMLKQMESEFQQDYGISMDDYMDAYREQAEMELQQMKEEEEKAESFPVLKANKDVKVEKVDEQNALIHISVGAPRSKKE